MFEIREVYGKSDFRALIHCMRSRGRFLHLSYKFSRVLSIFASLPFFLCSFYTLRVYFDGVLPEDTLPPIIFTFAVFFVLGLWLFVGIDPFIAWMSWLQYKYKGMEIVYTFEEDCFIEQTPLNRSQYDYAILFAITEDYDRWCLFFDKRMAWIIRRDSFSHGDPAQFRDFIQQKTGKIVQFIK